MLDVINVTGGTYESFFFGSLNSNFQQYKLRVAPFVGSVKNLWITTLNKMNATYIEVEDNFDIDTALYILDEVPHQHVYPLLINSQIIVVPESLPYSEFLFYLRYLTSDKSFVYSLVTIAAVMLLLIVFRYIQKKKILIFQSVTDVLNLLMNENGSINYRIDSYLTSKPCSSFH